MKKAKVMLTALALVAVVAGVFAAKAKVGQKVFTYDTQALKCTAELDDATTLTNVGGDEVSGTFVNTAPLDGACTFTSIYYTNVE